jgi:hypothetical protein
VPTRPGACVERHPVFEHGENVLRAVGYLRRRQATVDAEGLRERAIREHGSIGRTPMMKPSATTRPVSLDTENVCRW